MMRHLMELGEELLAVGNRIAAALERIANQQQPPAAGQ